MTPSQGLWRGLLLTPHHMLQASCEWTPLYFTNTLGFPCEFSSSCATVSVHSILVDGAGLVPLGCWLVTPAAVCWLKGRWQPGLGGAPSSPASLPAFTPCCASSRWMLLWPPDLSVLHLCCPPYDSAGPLWFHVQVRQSVKAGSLGKAVLLSAAWRHVLLVRAAPQWCPVMLWGGGCHPWVVFLDPHLLSSGDAGSVVIFANRCSATSKLFFFFGRSIVCCVVEVNVFYLFIYFWFCFVLGMVVFFSF